MLVPAAMAAESCDFDVEKQRTREADGCGVFSEDAEVGQSQDLVEKIVEVVVVDCSSKGEQEPGRKSTSSEECRVCQEENEEALINLGCQCRGGLAKAHKSCIVKWFNTRGSNKCEICQQVAANVAPPDSQGSIGTNLRQVTGFGGLIRPIDLKRVEGPLWVAFSVLIGGLLLDVLISIILGVSALPINIIIGVIVVLGLGTALRFALEFCQEWNVRRVVQRVEANTSLGYPPAL